MSGVSVELDDHALRAEKRIDGEACDVGVGFGGWDLVELAEGEEAFFEDAAGLGQFGAVVFERGPQRCAAWVTAAEGGGDFVEIQYAPVVGFGERASQAVGGRVGG